MHDKPILQVKNLTKQYGSGCSICTNARMKRWKKIIVRIVKPSMLAGIYRLISTKVKSLESSVRAAVGSRR